MQDQLTDGNKMHYLGSLEVANGNQLFSVALVKENDGSGGCILKGSTYPSQSCHLVLDPIRDPQQTHGVFFGGLHQ
jgi:hypothetical protein